MTIDGRTKHWHGGLEDINKIRVTLKQIFNILVYQHTWTQFTHNKWAEANISLTDVLVSHDSMFAGPSGSKGEKQMEIEVRAPQGGQKIKTKATMANLQKFRPGEIESEGKEDEIATRLGGGDPLIGHFTVVNLNSEQDEPI